MVLDWDRSSRELNIVKIIKDDKFIRPNDLVAVSANSFILANDGSAQSQIIETIHQFSMIPTGSIVYYDGQKTSWLLSKTTSPSSIVVHPDGKHLIISRASAKMLSVYIRKKKDYSLSHLFDIPLGTTTDNLSLDKEGAIWVVSY
ncbi:unnamed protein product [Strongylus vulgaris]|uniref:SMP-30/Gluconolactonase/LRE-like region domain-containing protein n=1 Tax=Strongylus vulgaris TaxID=40348 RepID=A0A3P7J7Y6_STRVU|nr:unnamed protein product [Strongylus vulgaris]